MTKSIDHHFRDWEAHVFGYGYGTGEARILPALRSFFALMPPADAETRAYDYRELETALGAPVAWFLINALCKADILEYGCSPRYAWLTVQGEALRAYVLGKTPDELYDVCCGSEDRDYCYPGVCNCGSEGFEKGRKCGNPFWRE